MCACAYMGGGGSVNDCSAHCHHSLPAHTISIFRVMSGVKSGVQARMREMYEKSCLYPLLGTQPEFGANQCMF